MTRSLSTLAISLAAVLVLAACGDSDSTETTTEPASQTDTPTESSTAPEVSGTDLSAYVTLVDPDVDHPEFEWHSESAPEGLYVQVIEEGDGPEVTATSLVNANYEGRTWGNTEEAFDSSYERGLTNFPLTSVIAGWTHGIAGHNVGSRLLISIPPDLGYGPQGGRPESGIEADDTLVFVVDVAQGWTESEVGESAGVDVPDGVPISFTSAAGEPAQFTVDSAATPPTEVVVDVISEGSGAAIVEGDSIASALTVTDWQNSLVESTWPLGEVPGSPPEVIPAAAGQVGEELIGVPVGSRVVMQIPQGEEVTVFVIDLLGTLLTD